VSKAVYICARHPDGLPATPADIEAVGRRLAADNITPHPTRVIVAPGLLGGIFNPVPSLPARHHSVCMGNLLTPGEDWWIPGADPPEGTHAIFRVSDEAFEVLTDMVGSRTVWYVHTDDLLVAATSQRALVHILQAFEPNPGVFPWMVFTGTLGLTGSWDRQIRRLQGNARLHLDRATWRLTVEERPVRFEPEPASVGEHARILRETIENAFSRLDLDRSKWILNG